MKAIDLNHPFHFLQNWVVSEEKFDKRVYVGRLDGDVNADHEWKFKSDLLLLVVDKVQVEGSADLEHGDKRDVGNQGFYKLPHAFGTFGWGAPSLVTRPSERLASWRKKKTSRCWHMYQSFF